MYPGSSVDKPGTVVFLLFFASKLHIEWQDDKRLSSIALWKWGEGCEEVEEGMSRLFAVVSFSPIAQNLENKSVKNLSPSLERFPTFKRCFLGQKGYFSLHLSCWWRKNCGFFFFFFGFLDFFYSQKGDFCRDSRVWWLLKTLNWWTEVRLVASEYCYVVVVPSSMLQTNFFPFDSSWILPWGLGHLCRRHPVINWCCLN